MGELCCCFHWKVLSMGLWLGGIFWLALYYGAHIIDCRHGQCKVKCAKCTFFDGAKFMCETLLADVTLNWSCLARVVNMAQVCHSKRKSGYSGLTASGELAALTEMDGVFRTWRGARHSRYFILNNITHG